MRFMLLVIPKGYEKAAPGTMPDAKIVGKMAKFNQELTKAGVLLGLDGLQPPSMGVRVTFSGGKAKVTDGPFSESKEVVGGYLIVSAASLDEATTMSKGCPILEEGGSVEVRQIHPMQM